MPTAYEGGKPYIFISYAHKDSAVIMPILDYMQSKGFLLWFDGGIEAGSEWPEYIASHITKSACMLTFMSEAYVKSNNCRRELNFAQDKNIPVLNVYIEDVKLTDGMSMQLSLSQSLFLKKFETNQRFLDALCEARLLNECKVKQEVSETVTAEVKQDNSETESKPVEQISSISIKPDAKRKTREDYIEQSPKKKMLTAITSIFELIYSVLGPYVLWLLTGIELDVWVLIVLMIIPHTAIALLNKSIFKRMGKNFNSMTRKDCSIGPFLSCIAASIIAVIVGSFFCQTSEIWILNFLISLGLNIIPAFVSFVINATLE